MSKYNRMAKIIRIQRKQNKSRMVGRTFCTIEANERRRIPWLGGAWFGEGRDEERADYIAEYKRETDRLLKQNPNLIIID